MVTENRACKNCVYASNEHDGWVYCSVKVKNVRINDLDGCWQERVLRYDLTKSTDN